MVTRPFANACWDPYGNPTDHIDCADHLRAAAAVAGLDVDVYGENDAMPPSPYALDPFRCPHGYEYRLLPTSEQIATWQRQGTP